MLIKTGIDENLGQPDLQRGVDRQVHPKREPDDERAEGPVRVEQLRQQLLEQFNLILETRDTARGLIVNMSDVLFDTAKFTLGDRIKYKVVAADLDKKTLDYALVA